MKTVFVFLGMSVIACLSIKDDFYEESNKSYDGLVDLIVLEYFGQEQEICLNEKSVSFEFKFPASFNGGVTKLSAEEISLIERELNSPPISWKNSLKTVYKSKDSFDCLSISKPIFFRNEKLAFVYESQSGAGFFSLYKKTESGWKFKETLMTTLH